MTITSVWVKKVKNEKNYFNKILLTKSIENKKLENQKAIITSTRTTNYQFKEWEQSDFDTPNWDNNGTIVNRVASINPAV